MSAEQNSVRSAQKYETMRSNHTSRHRWRQLSLGQLLALLTVVALVVAIGFQQFQRQRQAFHQAAEARERAIAARTAAQANPRP